jgi:catalase
VQARVNVRAWLAFLFGVVAACAIPVASDEHSLTIGPDGPLLLQDHYLIEQMANFNRERIPERQPHAKGSGAFGHFG